MDFGDKGIITQLTNIEARLGRPLASVAEELQALYGRPHAARRRHLMEHHGLSHVYADTLLAWLDEQRKTPDLNPLDAIYDGPRAALRPIHDAVLAVVQSFGAFEIVPKKGYVSLRRRKQFAMLGPGTRTRVDLGLNLRAIDAEGRLRQLPPGRLCQMEVALHAVADVDAELVNWLRLAIAQSE